MLALNVTLLAPSVGETLSTVGAVVSTVQLAPAGVSSVLPAASVAFTSKVCGPSERPVYSFGEVQSVKGSPSRLHWKVEPVSVEEKVKLVESLVTVPEGPESMVVSGAAVSSGTSAVTLTS